MRRIPCFTLFPTSAKVVRRERLDFEEDTDRLDPIDDMVDFMVSIPDEIDVELTFFRKILLKEPWDPVATRGLVSSSLSKSGISVEYR